MMHNLILAQTDNLANDNAKSPLHPQLADHGGRYAYVVGSAFDRETVRNPKRLGDAIRALLKAEEKAKRIPGKAQGVKYSVRVSWSGHTLSADVTIKGLTSIVNPAYVARFVHQPHAMRDPNIPRLAAGASELVRTLEAILATLNYDRSDSGTDYTDVGFFESIRIEGESEQFEHLCAFARAWIDALEVI